MASNTAAGASSATTMNTAKAQACIEAFMEARIPVMLWGAPGIGKSDLLRQIAKRRGWIPNFLQTVMCKAKGARPKFGFIDIRASQRDPVDVRGLPWIDAASQTARWLPPSELPQVERDGEAGILFMDEVTHAAPAMQAALFQLFLDRRLGEYELPEGWYIVAAGNRAEDKAGVQRMLAPLANRMAHLDIVPDLEAWSAWASENEIHPALIAFLNHRPNLLHMMPKEMERSFPTPRAWASVNKVIGAHSDIRLSLVSAIVGEGPAGEFEAFLRVCERIPDFTKILKSPGLVKVPNIRAEPALGFAIATFLSHKVDKVTLSNALVFMRMITKEAGKEFETLFVKSAIERDKSLKETVAFTQWAVENQDISL